MCPFTMTLVAAKNLWSLKGTALAPTNSKREIKSTSVETTGTVPKTVESSLTTPPSVASRPSCKGSSSGSHGETV